MTDILAELQRKWREAAESPAARSEWKAIRLEASGPLSLFAAIRERDRRPALILEIGLANAPKSPPQFDTDGLSLHDERLSDERRYRLAITLERNEYSEIFEILAVDLVNISSASGGDDRTGLRRFLERLAAWRACLRARTERLGYRAQVGLLGELTILKQFGSLSGYAVAVSAWKGAERGLHDFEWHGTSIEVKASSGIEERIYISRLDQLETEGIGRLSIARPRFHEDPKGKCVSDVVQEVSDEIARSAAASMSEFETKLLATGYITVDKPLYQKNRFSLQNLYGFDVRTDFPRLTRRNVAPGIVEASYVLNESAIADFRISQDQLRDVLRSMS